MSTSKHAFDQVKSILGKLDRAIDATRARRLDPHPALGSAAGGPAAPALAAPGADARRDPSTQFATPLAAPLAKLDPSQMTARPLRSSDFAPPLAAPAIPASPRPDFRR